MHLRMQWVKVLAAGLSAAILVACGGGGGGSSATGPGTTPAPTPAQPSFSLVGPQDTDPVTFACGNSDGDKTRARYPMHEGSFSSGVKLAALPDGGLVGRSRTGQAPSLIDTYFWIDKTGRRAAYTARALDDVRIDLDGYVWWVGADKVLWRGALQPNGQDERIGSTAGFGTVPGDGPSSQLALGPVQGFAATQGVAFLLVTDDAGARYFVRRMTRNANASWQSSSIAVPASVAQSGDKLRLLANRSGQLALVVERRTILNGTYPSFFEASNRISYWQWQADNAWHEVANKVGTSFAGIGLSGTSLVLDSATLGDDGNILWGGGGNASLYRMGQDGSWTVLARPGSISAAAVGQEGDLQKATFLSAYSVTSGPGGELLFYDGETCQVRKLVGQTLTTISGPSYAIRPHLAGASLLGFDSHNALVGVHLKTNAYDRDIHTVPRPQRLSYDMAGNRLSATDAILSLNATTGDGCGIARPATTRPCTNYDLGSGVYGSAAGMDSASGLLYTVDRTKLYRVDAAGAVTLATAPATVCTRADGTSFQSSSNFEGSQPDFPYFIVKDEVCPDPAATSWIGSYAAVLYRFDAASGTFQAVFPGKRPSFTGGGVQRRSDGGFWVAGNGTVQRLTSSGDLAFVAGSASLPAQAKDGQGAAAGFADIKRIRVLADNRLLVLDADAVRLVDDSGGVRTLFTLASSGIAGDAIVDLMPKGRDAYLTLANQPMLMLAKDVIP